MMVITWIWGIKEEFMLSRRWEMLGAVGGSSVGPGHCRPPLRGPVLTCWVSQPAVPPSPGLWKSRLSSFLSAFPPSQEHGHLDPSGAGGRKRQHIVQPGFGGAGAWAPQV